jgi:hypothetical protein
MNILKMAGADLVSLGTVECPDDKAMKKSFL